MTLLCRLFVMGFSFCLLLPEALALPFSSTLEHQGIRFRVQSPNEGSINQVTITPSGFKVKVDPIVQEIDGIISDAKVADLNGDGYPEVYVFTVSAGSGSYGNVIGYSSNRDLSLTEIFLPPLAEEGKAANRGYMGHDRFEIVEGRLVRQFPIYRQNDPNARPSSKKTRQIQYKLISGEAGWLLRSYKVFDITNSP
jgi:hypothetical protein